MESPSSRIKDQLKSVFYSPIGEHQAGADRKLASKPFHTMYLYFGASDISHLSNPALPYACHSVSRGMVDGKRLQFGNDAHLDFGLVRSVLRSKAETLPEAEEDTTGV